LRKEGLMGDVLWMVVSENGIHYTRRLIKDGLTEEDAETLKNSFREDKQNPEHFHKMDYYKFPYTAKTRECVIREERVLE
jgi:hypothetical protein